jgi:hypothetical protein
MLFFMMCTLHQDIPLYVLFPFMCFQKCFMTIFKKISWFEVWYICPLNTWKPQDLGFACIQGGKLSIFKSRKNRKNFHKSLWYYVQLYNYKIFFWKMPASWDTLVYMLIVLFCSAVHLKLLFLVLNDV